MAVGGGFYGWWGFRRASKIVLGNIVCIVLIPVEYFLLIIFVNDDYSSTTDLLLCPTYATRIKIR